MRVFNWIFLWVVLSIGTLSCSGVDFYQAPLVLKSHEVDVNLGVDILFVVDNSGSMKQEHRNLGDKIHGFLDIVRHLDYRIGITTTDVRKRNTPGADGTLMPLQDENGATSMYYLDTSIEFEKARSILKQTFTNVGTGGADRERGIAAAYRSIEKAVLSAPESGRNVDKAHWALGNFFREQAHLFFIVISDADDGSAPVLGSCKSGAVPTSNRCKGQPLALLDLIRSVWPQKRVVWNSIVVRGGMKHVDVESLPREVREHLEKHPIAPDHNCRSQGEEWGSKYIELSLRTDGVIGSVCSSDYTYQLRGMGQRAVDLQKSIELECVPLVGAVNGKDIQILVYGPPSATVKDWIPYEGDYKLEGRDIIFGGPSLPAGQYKIRYKCT